MLTGESVPVPKEEGQAVYAGALCKEGELLIRATGIGKQTTLSHVLQFIMQSEEHKASIARFVDKLSRLLIPVIFFLAALAAILWHLAGKESAFLLQIFLSVFILSCPCAWGIAVPIATTAGVKQAAHIGLDAHFAQEFGEQAHPGVQV